MQPRHGFLQFSLKFVLFSINFFNLGANLFEIPLGLRQRLLYVEPLPFGQVSSEDCELMQLDTVSESSPQTRMPFFGHLTIHSGPQVTLVHLAANLILLGLRVTRQEVPQKLIHCGNSLIVSL
jgi:hypothetical protein